MKQPGKPVGVQTEHFRAVQSEPGCTGFNEFIHKLRFRSFSLLLSGEMGNLLLCVDNYVEVFHVHQSGELHVQITVWDFICYFP